MFGTLCLQPTGPLGIILLPHDELMGKGPPRVGDPQSDCVSLACHLLPAWVDFPMWRRWLAYRFWARVQPVCALQDWGPPLPPGTSTLQ